MLERLKTAEFHCAKCNKSMKDISTGNGKCPDCGFSTGMSASMEVDIVFKGIDVPPEIMRDMKALLIRNLRNG